MSNYTSKGYTTPTGVNSREDVRQWQQRLGVTADGIWGKNTQAAYRKWRLNGGTGSASAAGAATGASLSGGTKQKTTVQQKNTSHDTSGNWWERLSSAISKSAGRKTAADPLPTPKRNYAVMSVNGIGAQYASGKAKTKQNTAPKKEVPKPQYEYPIYGTGAGGIGGQMHADEIAAAQQQQAEERKKKTYQNPYANRNVNYGTLGGWRESMPKPKEKGPTEYTGGLGGFRYHLQQTLADAPEVNVLLDSSQLTEERIAEAEKEKQPYQFKLADTVHETTAVDTYRTNEYEAMEAWSQLPAEARKPGQGSDYFQPAVEYLEGSIAQQEQDLRYWLNLKSRGNPVLTKDADMMIASLREDIKQNKETLSKLIYVLPEDILRNEFGAKYADLLSQRTLDKEQRKQVKAAIDDLKATRLACYIDGEYGRSAAAADILNVLERKQAWMAGTMGAVNNFALGIPDYVVSSNYAKQNTDYDRFLNYMYSADAIQAANPNAYAAGDAAATALSLAMAGTGIYKAGVRQFGDDAINMIGGKDQFQRVGEETLKKYAEWLRDELIAIEMENGAKQQYRNDRKR